MREKRRGDLAGVTPVAGVHAATQTAVCPKHERALEDRWELRDGIRTGRLRMVCADCETGKPPAARPPAAWRQKDPLRPFICEHCREAFEALEPRPFCGMSKCHFSRRQARQAKATRRKSA